MALTNSYTAPTGVESQEAYAVISHERYRRLEGTADFAISVFHSKSVRDGAGEPIRRLDLSFSNGHRFGVDGGLAGRVHELERQGAAAGAIANEIGIPVMVPKAVTEPAAEGEEPKEPELVESTTWKAELANWLAAHPTCDELFGKGTDPDRAKTLYTFLSTHYPDFKDWKAA